VDDQYFGPGYVDIDEWREDPVRHRYVHGGFEGTDTRFSFYFPPPEQYQRRFLQFLEGGTAGHENTAANQMSLGLDLIQHAFSCGAYLVESNQGHLADEPSRPMPDNDVLSFGASAESARFSRGVAAEMYGAAPEHGYVYGISGGGVRSINCIEHVSDVWDGAVPCAIPYAMTFYALAGNAGRVLEDRIFDVIDATDVGGSGDPFEGLTHEQRTVLSQLYRAGYARGAEFMLQPGFSPPAYGMSGLMPWDPQYFVDFWEQPGYLGHDEPSLFEPFLFETKATVARTYTGQELLGLLGDPAAVPPGLMMALAGDLSLVVAVELEGLEDATVPLPAATMRVASGKAKGRLLYCSGALGSIVMLGAMLGGPVYEDVAAGDVLEIHNRDRFAFDYSYLYQASLESELYPEFHFEWQQFVIDGNLVYPRREALSFANTESTRTYEHKFPGRKMMLLTNAFDGTNWPTHGENYARFVRRDLGDAVDESFRLYFVDHAAHGPAMMYPPGQPPVTQSRVIDYGGVFRQAVRDLIAWVEDAVEPLPSTGYEWTADGRLVFAEDAATRSGFQPVITATANGGERAEVAVGEPVQLRAVIEAPPGAGFVVAADWDFEGLATWSFSHELDGTSALAEIETTHTFDQPGVYFPSLRAALHRDGDLTDRCYRAWNIARVRVVVT
jgi:hypothetical protein